MSTPEPMEYELFSHEAYIAGHHGNFARSLARAAAAADGVNRDLLRFFWPQIVHTAEHSPHTEAPRTVPRVRLLAVKVEHPQRKDGRWGAAGSCSGLFDAVPGSRCSDCDAQLFGTPVAQRLSQEERWNEGR